MAATLNQARYASHRGVSRKTVTKWKERGLLVLLADGSVDVAATDAKLAAHNIEKREPVTRKSVPVTSRGKVTPVTSDQPEPQDDGRIASKADAEKVKETYLALLRKMEFDEKSGEVARISTVIKRVGEEYARVRSRLMSIPAEVAPKLAALKTAEEVRDCLDAEINQALTELSADDGRAVS